MGTLDQSYGNLTANGLPKAPAVIQYNGELVSSSDFGKEQVRKLMNSLDIAEVDINQIMSGRTLAKLGHGYKKVTLRRTGERYIDHTNGVFLILLLEFGILDPDILSASHLHDFKEDVEIDFLEMENLIVRSTSRGTYHIVDMVTNPRKTGDKTRDIANKNRHYSLMASNKKACILKTADRCYNLRTLEIMQKEVDKVSEKDVLGAENQVAESKEFILPLAKTCGLEKFLMEDINKVEIRIREARLALIQSNVAGAVPKV